MRLMLGVCVVRGLVGLGVRGMGIDRERRGWGFVGVGVLGRVDNDGEE